MYASSPSPGEVKRFLEEERRRARKQGKDLYVILDNFGSHRALRGCLRSLIVPPRGLISCSSSGSSPHR